MQRLIALAGLAAWSMGCQVAATTRATHVPDLEDTVHYGGTVTITRSGDPSDDDTEPPEPGVPTMPGPIPPPWPPKDGLAPSATEFIGTNLRGNIDAQVAVGRRFVAVSGYDRISFYKKHPLTRTVTLSGVRKTATTDDLFGALLSNQTVHSLNHSLNIG